MPLIINWKLGNKVSTILNTHAMLIVHFILEIRLLAIFNILEIEIACQFYFENKSNKSKRKMELDWLPNWMGVLTICFTCLNKEHGLIWEFARMDGFWNQSFPESYPDAPLFHRCPNNALQTREQFHSYLSVLWRKSVDH